MTKPEESKKTVTKTSVEVEKTELAETKSVGREGPMPGGTGQGPRPEITEPVAVTLTRSESPVTDDESLWVAIRQQATAMGFNLYREFIEKVFCDPAGSLNQGPLGQTNQAKLIRQHRELYNPLYGVGAYELLKTATQVFLLLHCGVPIISKEFYDSVEESSRQRVPLRDINDMLRRYLGVDSRLPYIQTIINNVFSGLDEDDSIFCGSFLRSRADSPPLIELIWSYWHEEAMLVQSMNAISLRFQNRRSAAARDPLAHLELAPLFPLNNLLWGYIQDEQQRLSVPRRAYEYDHHYGLTLAGKAIPNFRPADTRSKFLEAFHQLLYMTTAFFKQDDDTTVIADGFPILNALKEVHLLLAEGAHNQFGDLPWTSKAEMLMEQWMLSRPEMQTFLQSRHMVPYREGWMGPVDTMKRLQGWTDVTSTHFNELAIYGEQLLLSIRYGNWNLVSNHAQAANWARSWRPEIQNYIHSYRAVTGVDLRADLTTSQQRQLLTTLPTVLIQQRLLNNGKSAPALPAPMAMDTPKSFRERRAARRVNGTGR